MMHCQIYTTFTGHVDEYQTVRMRQSFEPLFVRYKVNLVVGGHDHGYLRTKPMTYGRSDPTGRGPVYVIVGEGGNREHHSPGYKNAEEAEEWTERRDRSEYGFGTLEVRNSTWARWRWIRDPEVDDAVDRVDVDGTELGGMGGGGRGVTDDVWLQNPHVP